MNYLYLRVIAFLTKREVVELIHYDGYRSLTLAKPYIHSYDKLECYVYWFNEIGHCLLLNDGSVDGRSYIHRWRYRSKSKRRRETDRLFQLYVAAEGGPYEKWIKAEINQLLKEFNQ